MRDVVQTKGAINEVRNLDQRSAAAAREIRALVDDSVEKVQAGSRLVDQAGATMADIVQGVSAASAGQNTGIEQVSGAITQMDQATSQIAGPCRGSSGRHGRLGKGLMQG